MVALFNGVINDRIFFENNAVLFKKRRGTYGNMMVSKLSKLTLGIMLLLISACMIGPGYYGDGGPGGPSPNYGYYGYAPAYPWDTGVNVDIANGYGHGGYGGRGGPRGGGHSGGGGHGGGRGGGHR